MNKKPPPFKVQVYWLHATFKFLENLIKLLCFIDGKSIWVRGKHSYEVGDNKLLHLELGWGLNEQSKIHIQWATFCDLVFKHLDYFEPFTKHNQVDNSWSLWT